MAIDSDKYTSVLVNFPNEVLEKVEKYWHEKHLRSRTQGIIELVEKGLKDSD